jgi:GNAT superfamily N-acetyltransferase
VEIELREVPTDDPSMLRLAEALRDEVEERGAHNSAPRPEIELAEAIRADSDTLVAYVDQEPIGMGALRLAGTGIAEIKRMYVRPAYRGSGVAGRILDELERRARERGLRAIRLDTNSRLTEAIGMYMMAAEYRRIGDYNGNPRSDRWFEKSPRLSFHNSSSRALPTHGDSGIRPPLWNRGVKQDPAHLPWRALSAMVTGGAACVSCGSREDLVAHHKMPRRYGGLDVIENLEPVCRSCHPVREQAAIARAEFEWERPEWPERPPRRPPPRLLRPY